MLGFIKTKLTKAYQAVTHKLAHLFTGTTVDQAWLDELRKILLAADTGPAMTNIIVARLEEKAKESGLSGENAQKLLAQILESLLPPPAARTTPRVLLVVGVNGSGKTTFVGKLAAQYGQEGKRTLLIAGDTFRAAAVQQLAQWAVHAGATLHCGKEGQDPASVIFDGCRRFREENFDHLIIDTAGRLQSKTNLMQELAKIKRTIHKCLPEAPFETWLVLDSMLGQNSLAQAHQFHEATTLSGLVITKCDGTGKAGFLLNIAHDLQLPVTYITFGEKSDAMAAFDSSRFIRELLAP